ncbi:MAG: hypothetical protein DRZ82_02665 [Thermoprotei archaeon]|nr:MAG: hypothetical protein DRZ82_02665 [Thermoprotei archaeon]
MRRIMMNPWIRLIRPINCIMMGIATFVGAIIALGGVPPLVYTEKLIYAFITAFTLTAASMILNDYFDREIDKINDPTRPIPSGAIKPNEAIAYAIVLILIGLVSAFLTNLRSFIVALVACIVSVVYNAYGKRFGLIGNLMVSFCVAVPFLYGGLAVDTVRITLIIFMSMAFLANTGREVMKGIVDIEGDKRHGILTVAVRYGARSAAMLTAILFIIAVLLSVLPPILKLTTWLYVPLVIITDLGLIRSSLMVLKRPTKEVALREKKKVLLWMLIGLIAFMAGSIKS